MGVRADATPNILLSRVRQGTPSQSGSGRAMSRQELADAVNAYLFVRFQMRCALDETYIGKLERGEHRWPNAKYREAFRAILHAQADAQLGFYIVRTQRSAVHMPDGGTALPGWRSSGRVGERSDPAMDDGPERGSAIIRSPGGGWDASMGSAPYLDPDMVRRSLDDVFPAWSARRLLLDVGQAENSIVALARQVVLAAMRHDADVSHPQLLDSVVRLAGRTIVVKVQPDLHCGQWLHIVIHDPKFPHPGHPGHYIHETIELTGHVGQYRQIRLAVPQYLDHELRHRLTTQVRNVFEVGYQWFHERLRSACTGLTGALERQALALLRQRLPTRGGVDVTRQLWLVKVVDGRVTYAVDDDVLARMLRAGHDYPGLQQAPASIACALLANSIPLDKSYSRQAIGQDRTVAMTLANAPYEGVNTAFLVAQSAIYADQMLLTPLVGDRRGWILAAHPPSSQTVLADTLAATRSDLQEFFQTDSAPMRPALVHSNEG